jgi:hypothetical protein
MRQKHAALKARWRDLRGGDPPKRLSRQLLLRALAYAVQVGAFGGLSANVRQRLRRLGAELQATGRMARVLPTLAAHAPPPNGTRSPGVPHDRGFSNEGTQRARFHVLRCSLVSKMLIVTK